MGVTCGKVGWGAFVGWEEGGGREGREEAEWGYVAHIRKIHLGEEKGPKGLSRRRFFCCQAVGFLCCSQALVFLLLLSRSLHDLWFIRCCPLEMPIEKVCQIQGAMADVLRWRKLHHASWLPVLRDQRYKSITKATLSLRELGCAYTCIYCEHPPATLHNPAENHN